ncbi:hypothetical protein [Burkholderia plantarii]|uniref:hypothetical protein n=1 Tax=Burkholderia plantarii TaxID=41899 RepID=UPI0006D88A59|nr:hypothetical protein [Burkholderia plantarii]GLZ18333.1 hypothetical protein Bpla01_18630 [Burkholderia plantarii]
MSKSLSDVQLTRHVGQNMTRHLAHAATCRAAGEASGERAELAAASAVYSMWHARVAAHFDPYRRASFMDDYWRLYALEASASARVAADELARTSADADRQGGTHES